MQAWTHIVIDQAEELDGAWRAQQAVLVQLGLLGQICLYTPPARFTIPWRKDAHDVTIQSPYSLTAYTGHCVQWLSGKA